MTALKAAIRRTRRINDRIACPFDRDILMRSLILKNRILCPRRCGHLLGGQYVPGLSLQQGWRRHPLFRSRSFVTKRSLMRRDGFVPIGCGVQGGVYVASDGVQSPATASGTPPSLRPPSAILDATGAHEETHTAATQNAAPVMDAASWIHQCARCLELSGSIGSSITAPSSRRSPHRSN